MIYPAQDLHELNFLQARKRIFLNLNLKAKLKLRKEKHFQRQKFFQKENLESFLQRRHPLYQEANRSLQPNKEFQICILIFQKGFQVQSKQLILQAENFLYLFGKYKFRP